MKLPAPALAARKTAATFVERLDLRPPVDIRSLVEARAQLERLDWPYQQVDAVLTGLGTQSPIVYYRATNNVLRERFTLAHELGHLVLQWHLPIPRCEVGPGVLDLPRYSPEDEADVFASCVLMPDYWIDGLLRTHDGDMSGLLRDAEKAEVTTIALLRGLRRVLLAGWVFLAYNNDQIISSVGTHAPALNSGEFGRELRRQLANEAHDHDELQINGSKVYWYRMHAPNDLPALDPSDGRTNHEVLKDAISRVESDPARQLFYQQSCNGKVGGILRSASGRPSQEMYDALLHRLDADAYNKALLTEPDFMIWLARKVRDVEAGTTKRRGSGSRRS